MRKIAKKLKAFFLSLSFRVTRQESRIGEAQLVATKKWRRILSSDTVIFITKNNKRLWLLQTKKKKKLYLVTNKLRLLSLLMSHGLKSILKEHA